MLIKSFLFKTLFLHNVTYLYLILEITTGEIKKYSYIHILPIYYIQNLIKI